MFDVDAGATTSLVMQRSIDSPKMIENSPPEELFLLFLVVATYGPVNWSKIAWSDEVVRSGMVVKIPVDCNDMLWS